VGNLSGLHTPVVANKAGLQSCTVQSKCFDIVTVTGSARMSIANERLSAHSLMKQVFHDEAFVFQIVSTLLTAGKREHAVSTHSLRVMSHDQ
jgi:hypothetical protein